MAARVIGADHDDRNFWLELIQFMTVGNSPQNVARLVAANAEVDRLEGTEVFLPGFLAFPAVRDGIAQEDDVAGAVALLDAFEEVLVPRDVAVDLVDGRVVRDLLLCGQEGSRQTQCQHAAGGDQTVHGVSRLRLRLTFGASRDRIELRARQTGVGSKQAAVCEICVAFRRRVPSNSSCTFALLPDSSSSSLPCSHFAD